MGKGRKGTERKRKEVGVRHRCVFVFGKSPIGVVLAATGGSTLGGCGAFIRSIHLDEMGHWGADHLGSCFFLGFLARDDMDGLLCSPDAVSRAALLRLPDRGRQNISAARN